MKKQLLRILGVLANSCTWRDGSGEVADPNGKKWYCIQCNPPY